MMDMDAANPQVDRKLPDNMFERMDIALGRRRDPEGPGLKNSYHCASADIADALRAASRLWVQVPNPGSNLETFAVTEEGRRALKIYLTGLEAGQSEVTYDARALKAWNDAFEVAAMIAERRISAARAKTIPQALRAQIVKGE